MEPKVQMGKSNQSKQKFSEEDSKLKWPSVSFAIATYNSARTLDRCLYSIKKQEYPSSVEIVIADGESKDGTLDIAKKYKAKILSVPKEKQGAEYNKGIAVNAAKNEILVLIDCDNILPHKNWLKNMIRPLLKDGEIFGAGVFRFHYNKRITILDRYFALLGGTDPVAFFLNKSAHQSWLYKKFHLRGKLLEEKSGYFKVKLDPKKMPALGGNGAVLWRRLLKKAKSDPDNFFHIDIHVDLVKKGYLHYAFVKETIIHLTNNKLLPFLKRRKYYIEKYHFEDNSRRRYSIYQPEKDRLALLGYILYSLSLIFPTLDAFRGFIKIRDIAWFIHPFMCLAMLFVYGLPTIREESKHVFLGKR